MGDTKAIDRIRAVYRAAAPLMDERARRHWAAAEARAYGRGGIRAVSAATGLSPHSIRKGLDELGEGSAPGPRIRRHGGGRKRRTEENPGLRPALERLLRDDVTVRTSRFHWTCQSTASLARELGRLGHPVSPRTVGRLLRDAGYRLDGNRPHSRRPGDQGRQDQFRHIARTIDLFSEWGQPVVLVTLRSEANPGSEHARGRDPIRAAPRDKLFARFAAQAVARWWDEAGPRCVPRAGELLVVVDGCGSDTGRRRSWKAAFLALPTKLRLPVQVCHLPPGITRWDAAESWAYSKASRASRGHATVRHEVVIRLLVAGRPNKAAGGIVPDTTPDGGQEGREAMPEHSSRLPFAGDWNYRLVPS